MNEQALAERKPLDAEMEVGTSSRSGRWFRQGRNIVVLLSDSVTVDDDESQEDLQFPRDVIDSRIDVDAQRALISMAGSTDSATINDAFDVLDLVKTGRLGGIYKENQRVPALLAQKRGTGWWQLLPRPQFGDWRFLCDPGKPDAPPIVVFRRNLDRQRLIRVLRETASLKMALQDPTLCANALTSNSEIHESVIGGFPSRQPLLRKGNRGGSVAYLQRLLNTWAAGSRLPVARLQEDGIFGPATEQRVRSFQRVTGLPADGIAGPETLAALRAAIGRIGSANIPAQARISPRCSLVSGYATGQREVNALQRQTIERIAFDIVRSLVPPGSGGPPVTLVTVEGHTDSVGSLRDNRTLGLDRANAVIAALRKALRDTAPSVSAPVFQPLTGGEENPIATNNTPEGRAENRRVVVCLFGGGIFL